MISTPPDISRDLENMGIELMLLGFTDGHLLALEFQPTIVEEIKVSKRMILSCRSLDWVLARENCLAF